MVFCKKTCFQESCKIRRKTLLSSLFFNKVFMEVIALNLFPLTSWDRKSWSKNNYTHNCIAARIWPKKCHILSENADLSNLIIFRISIVYEVVIFEKFGPHWPAFPDFNPLQFGVPFLYTLKTENLWMWSHLLCSIS